MKKVLVKTAAVLMVLNFISVPLWAKVTVDPSFTGTLILTTAEGEVTLYESGDPLPEIPQGATLEVFDGSVSVKTEAGDSIQLGCFGSEQAVGGGSTAELTCGADTGLLKVDGKEYPLKGAEAAVAEPTAALDPTGVPTDQDPAPDSRSIQASTIS